MLQLQAISKSFPGVKALKDVSLFFRAGQVHALCGENGAGKSTLMHIIAGSLLPDAGTLYWNNEPVVINSVAFAQQLGISIVYQERTLADSLTVAENIFPVNPPRDKLGFIDIKNLQQKAAHLLQELGLTHISSKALAGSLSAAGKQMVEIARALAQKPALLILDEPTASLTTAETTVLFDIIRKLAAKGTGIIYISHRMAELTAIADKISVLKDGEFQGSFDAKTTAPHKIVSSMVGRVLAEATYVSHAQDSPALEARGVSGHGFNDISFVLHAGEVLGIAGLEGSGRTALAKAIFGDQPLHGGQLLKKNKPVVFHHPAGAIAAGIAYLPEERKSLGLFGSRDIASNIMAASMRGYWYHKTAEKQLAETYKTRLDIKASSVWQQVQDLSGGNQQKVVLAKWLQINPDILIINEPTHGVDVGAKASIYQILKQLTAAGKSLLLISSDLPELLLLSDRVMVMYNGKARAILNRQEMQEERITALASGI